MKLSQLESSRKPARNLGFRPGSTLAQHVVGCKALRLFERILWPFGVAQTTSNAVTRGIKKPYGIEWP